MVDYRVSIDFDRDGYVHKSTASTDALNLLPSPVEWRGLFYRIGGDASGDGTGINTSFNLIREETAYGVFVLRLTMPIGSTNPDGVHVGKHPATLAVDSIAVTAGSTYTFKVWVKSPTLHSNTEFQLRVYDQDDAQIATTTDLFPETYWTAVSLTFTAPTGTTHVALSILKSPPHDGMILDTAGWMLVAGSSAPTAFNAGGIHYRDNITTYVRALSFSDGMETAYKGLPIPARCVIALDNAGKHWLPEYASSPLYGHISKGALVFVEADHLGTTYPLWRGTIADIQVSGDDTDPVCLITAEDGMSLINTATYEPELLTDVLTGTALSTLFETGILAYPYAGAFCLLDAAGYAELDSTARLYDDYITDFDAGKTRLAYIGDNLDAGSGIGAQNYIASAIGAEAGGRLFWNAATGKYVYHDRHRDILQAGSYTALARTDVDSVRYAWGDRVVNRLTINYLPRRLGSPGTVMYSMENLPVRLAPNAVRAITAAYRVGDSVGTTGGIDMIYPVAGTDYAAASEVNKNNSDGSAQDRTGSLAVLVAFGANSARITITNTGSDTINVTSFQLRGTPLIADARATVTSVDGSSIGANGLHENAMDIPALSDGAFVQQYADYTVRRFKTAFGRLESVRYAGHRSSTALTNALSLTCGSFVEIDDAYLDNAQTKYVVVGRSHEIGVEMNTHYVTLVLQPVERQIFAILNASTAELDAAYIAL